MSDRPPKPEPLSFNPDGVPEDLREKDRWICWRYGWDSDREEWTKKPKHVPGGYTADPTDSGTWGTFEEAREHHETHDTDGVGFVLTDDDTIMGVDLDDARDPDREELLSWAEEIPDRLNTFTEVSPSGTGLHMLGLGFVPDGRTQNDVGEGEIELYDSERYFTVTGHRLDSTPESIEQIHKDVKDLHSEHIAKNEPEDTDSGTANPTQNATKPGGNDLADDKLIEKAKNADDGGKFRRLWNGDTSKYDSHSEAQMGLANELAFWTGGDRQRMVRLFKQSDMIRGDDDLRKFKNHDMNTALEGRTEFYDPPNVTDGEDCDATDGEDSEDSEENSVEDGDATDREDSEDSTKTDGGTAAVSPQPDDQDRSPARKMTPEAVRALEGLSEDQRLSDLPARDRAYSATRIITRQPDVHIGAVEPNNKFYAVNEETVWVPEGENVLRKKLQKTLGRAYQQSVLNESKEWIMGRMGPDLRHEDLGAPEWRVPVGNGLLNLNRVIDGDGENALRPLQPEDHALNRLQAPYQPDADAPRFEEYLQEVCRKEDIPKLQEYAGYSLYHWGQPFKKAMVLVGPTDSGKSTFTKLMRALIGPDNVASQTLFDLISTKWGTAQLYGNMVNIRNELTSSELNRPERFKEITGGEEQIDAQRKREKKFQFVVTQKFLFSTNDVPKIDGADPAFYNRWLFASFPNTIPEEEQDPDLFNELVENELPGILNWALEGLTRLLENEAFTNERDAEEKKQMWQEKSGLINRFKSEILEVTGDSKDAVPKSDVHDMLSAYADYLGKENPTQTKLTRRLKKDGDIGDKEQSGTRYFTGVRIAEESIGGRKPLDSDSHKQGRF